MCVYNIFTYFKQRSKVTCLKIYNCLENYLDIFILLMIILSPNIEPLGYYNNEECGKLWNNIMNCRAW